MTTDNTPRRTKTSPARKWWTRLPFSTAIRQAVRRRFLRVEPLEDRRVLASPGDLDSSFGLGGLVTTEFFSHATSSDQAFAVASQSDGKVVIAGSGGVIARFTTEGQLDGAFGVGGKAAFGGTAAGIVVQSDGKIVVAGDNGNNDFKVARYTSEGKPDPTFNLRGWTTTDFGGLDIGNSVAVHSDGTIVVAGFTTAGAGRDFALARYTSLGALDSTFDTDGKVTTSFGPNNDIAYGVAIQSDGKVVAAGSTDTGGVSNNDFAVARFNTDGSLDTTFSVDRLATSSSAALQMLLRCWSYPGHRCCRFTSLATAAR